MYKSLPLLSAGLFLIACASDQPRAPAGVGMGTEDAIACPRGKIAVCVETDCKPENYACTDTDAVRKMLEPGAE